MNKIILLFLSSLEKEPSKKASLAGEYKLSSQEVGG